MISSKTWTFLLVGSIASVVLVNYVIWIFFTKDILTFEPWYNGGLDRMAYVVGSKYYRKPENTLPRKHLENKQYNGQRVDVLTVGDSFSNVRENGLNPLYQDWIATIHDLSVLNVQPLKGWDPYTTVIILMNSGYLDKIKPRYVVLETVERHCVIQCSRKTDFGQTMPLADIEAYYRTAEYRTNTPLVSFLNSGNLKFLVNSVLYRFSDRAFVSKVVVRDLDRPLFSVKNGKRLLYYYEDVTNIPLATPELIGRMNDNLNELADHLRQKGIGLYFLPAADKYNMYSAYIRENPYARSEFFERLRRTEKRYRYVDTKALLSDDIDRGEQDMYYSDDTHWSWKSVKQIAEDMKFSLPANKGTGDRSSQRSAGVLP